MPTEEMFINNSLSYAHVFEVMEEQNLSETQFNHLLWGLLGESIGESKRVFEYSATFAETKPDCGPAFSRSFEHVDWIDGESIVQAEENSVEEGFNSRFHKIEDDLDGLGADVAKAFACIAEMRVELAARLAELKVAINTINTDIYNKHKDDDAGGGGWWTGPYIPVDPPLVFEPPLRNPPRVPPRQPGVPGVIGPYPGGVQPYPVPGTLGPWINEVDFEDMIGGGVTTPVATVIRKAGDPTVATVAGMPAKRLDIQMMNGAAHEVWSTSIGLVLTPAGEGVSLADHTERSWNNPRAEAVGHVAAWVDENQTGLAQLMRDGVTVAELAEKLGSERLEGGLKLGDALGALPSGTKLQKPAQLVDMLAERAASAVKKEGLGNETMVANFGAGAGGETVANAPLETFKALPEAARKALVQQGVRTVGQFQAKSAKQISEMLANSPTPVKAPQAARWIGEVRVLNHLGKR